MKTFESVREMSAYSSRARGSNLDIGLVPTMGALHEGHMSLVRGSVSGTDRAVVSIFVNPTQFGPGEDLDRYPRDIDGDLARLEEAGVDCVFLPTPEMMYPDGCATYVVQEKLTQILEGAGRPTHFRGVLTVVLKLFNIVRPDRAYFGRKDYQQSVVVRRMVDDLNVPVDIVVMPTVREEDGLAMSSRNRYLSAAQTTDAVCLYRALLRGREVIEGGERSAQAVTAAMKKVVEGAPSARVDYLAVVDPDSLGNIGEIRGEVVLAGAVYVGSTRLIDNVLAGRRS